MSRPRLPIADRLAKYINRTETCWLWTGAISHAGKARMTLANGSSTQDSVEVHRLIYERDIGPIPPGARLYHTCDTPHCVNPAHLRLRVPLAERVEKYIDRNLATGCWLWTGARNHAGYGQVNPGAGTRKSIPAHRAVYELHVGPIPHGMTLHHTCTVRHCVNPGHLVPMSAADNAALNESPPSRKKLLTVCPRCGGPFSFRADGHRVCLPCKAAYQKRTWKGQRHRQS